MWYLSFPPGIKPKTPALQGWFLTIGPPGKSRSWNFLKSNREVMSVCHWDRRSEWLPFPSVCRLICRLLIPHDLLLDIFLFTQFISEITKGEAKEETWSSVNYLFFISTSLIYGKNQKIRQGIVWLKDLKSVLGLEMNRAWQRGLV